MNIPLPKPPVEHISPPGHSSSDQGWSRDGTALPGLLSIPILILSLSLPFIVLPSLFCSLLPPHSFTLPPPYMELSRQEYRSGLPFLSPGYLPNPGIEPGSPALQADSLPSEPPGKLLLRGIPWRSNMISLRAWVQHLVGELRSCMPHSTAKKKR